jgi:hypothetical protein
MEANVISQELSTVVHTAAKAAMDYALKAGVAKDVAEKISEAATEAAIALLDPTGASSLAKDGEDALPTAERIENSLARAVKQNAVRTMNIFRDCACSAPSRPRARLSNSCAAAAGLPACLAGSWTQPHTQHTRVHRVTASLSDAHPALSQGTRTATARSRRQSSARR